MAALGEAAISEAIVTFVLMRRTLIERYCRCQGMYGSLQLDPLSTWTLLWHSVKPLSIVLGRTDDAQLLRQLHARHTAASLCETAGS